MQLIKQLRPIASSVMEQSNKMYQAFKEDAERRYARQNPPEIRSPFFAPFFPSEFPQI
jgi:hypothetical protein